MAEFGAEDMLRQNDKWTFGGTWRVVRAVNEDSLAKMMADGSAPTWVRRRRTRGHSRKQV